jgi:Zn-dependent protease with chaperone function
VTPLAAVLACGLALGVGAPLALERLPRLERWPQLAAYLWLAATGGALGALVLAGVLLVVPTGGLAVDVAMLLRTCVMALRDALASPGGAPGALAGLALLALVPAGLAAGAVAAGVRARRATRLHRDLLALAGRPAPALPGVTVLDHAAPLAYCLAGRSGPVVLSTATLARLDPQQLAAVLAHERAHQSGRHHALVLAAEVLRTGFCWLPAARAGRAAVGRLVELAADDAAARARGRAQVADALARLGAVPTPAPGVGLGVGGVSVGERVGRLATPAAPGGTGALLTGVLVVAVPLAAEVLALAGPLVRVAGVPVCPLG